VKKGCIGHKERHIAAKKRRKKAYGARSERRPPPPPPETNRISNQISSNCPA